MRRRNRRRRFVLLAGVALGTAAIVGGLVAVGALRSVELNTVDQRFAIRGSRAPRPDVVLVGLDSRTIAALGRPPLGRGLQAQVIERLHRSGARVIAEDFRFQGLTAPAADNALIRAISRGRPVVLATADPDGTPLPVPAGVTDPRRIGATLASIGVPNDTDGKVRTMLYAPVALKSFPVRTAEVALGHPVSEAHFSGNLALVDFPGGPGTVPTYSLVDVLRGKVPPGSFRGRVVVVGPTDPIEKDVFITSASDLPMAGPEIQADSIATILSGFPLRYARGLIDDLLIALMVLIGPLLAARRSPKLVIPAAVAALAVFLVGAQLAFDAGWVVSTVAPVLGLVIATAGAVTIHYGLEAGERRRLRSLFARFVPPDVVDDVIARVDGDLRLGAVRRESTVMFSDLRGFTAFSESLAPEDVVQVVNRYLEEMSDAILAHGGTLVSFAGDGIMALFGAPLEQRDHADRAVAAAREMVEQRLPTFNRWVSEHIRPHAFRMGIGVNSGLVMSGNVGSERRVEYTALGDTTNTASRIEAMTKDTPHQVLIADSTHALLQVPVADLVEAGEAAVRGRAASVKLWALAGPAS